jgi:hypothetical protein
MGLVQEVVEKGQKQLAPVLPRMFHHFTKTALVAEKDEETNQYRRSVKKVGIDPHFSYANMLCDVAWSRAHGTSTFIMPDSEPEREYSPKAIAIPSSTTSVLEDIKIQLAMNNTCGKCRFRDPATSYCSELQAFVKPIDPGCYNYESRDEY